MKKNKAIYTYQDAVKRSAPVAFSTMIKPAGSTCNLDCHYCYYLDKALQYGGKQAVMSDELLEIYVRQYIEANEVPEVQFCWHGGEPLLLGVEFYRKAIEFQKIYADGKKINNTLQTNGMLLNEEWCEFFKENDFLIGVSIDGPKDIHDSFRLTKNQQPTFDKVMEGVNMMRRMGVEFNTLSVVNNMCEGRGAEIYQFFKSIGSKYMQFLPAVEHVVDKPNFHRPLIVSPESEGAHIAEWSVSAKGYGQFLIDIFDQWVINDVGTYYVQMFDATLANTYGVMPGVCSMGETCGDALVVEHNGDVYSCDHFVYPEYRLGNITDEHLIDIYNKRQRIDFGLAKRNGLAAECLKCRYYTVCRGECPKHRFDTGGDGYRKSTLCAGLKRYFKYVEPYMEFMTEQLKKGQAPAWVMPFARQRMGLM